MNFFVGALVADACYSIYLLLNAVVNRWGKLNNVWSIVQICCIARSRWFKICGLSCSIAKQRTSDNPNIV